MDIEKNKAVTGNFICLPDPENVFEWYYIVFNLDQEETRGGYYMGVVTCPQDYLINVSSE